MATATEKTEMVTEMRSVEVEKVTGVVLELSLEEACHVAALVGKVGGEVTRPGRAVAGRVWRALSGAIGDRGGSASITYSKDYRAARDSYAKIEIEA